MSEAQLEASRMIELVDQETARVRTRAVDVSFNELYDMYQNRELVIEPDFQRLFRWSEVKQSQFIESLLLELPVPPIYVIEIQDGVYELIDGLQRISSYIRFRGGSLGTERDDGPLVLNGCDVLDHLNGQQYLSLPHALQIKLKRHFIRMEVLRRESDQRLRYHMFKRLNTGGVLLSDQELRNCTVRLLGTEFIDFLKECARIQAFADCMIQLTDEKRDQGFLEEYALRFFALKNDFKRYKKEIGDFLTSYMEAVSDSARREVQFGYAEERKTFEKTFQTLHLTLGDGAFSGFNKSGTAMGYFSALHFEAYTLGLQPHLDRIDLTDLALLERLKNGLLSCKTDKAFRKETTGGGKNYRASIKRRIQLVADKVQECIG